MLATVAARPSSSSTDAPRSSGSAGRFIAVQPELAPKRCKSCWPTRGRDRLEGSDVRVESMHPGWGGNAGCRSLPADVSQDHPPAAAWGRRRRRYRGGAGRDPAGFETRPFWHDRVQRPTTFGWQRVEDPAKVAHVLKEMSAMTGTPNEWVVWVRHRIDCRLHRAPENGEPYRYPAVPSPRWRGRVRRTCASLASDPRRI